MKIRNSGGVDSSLLRCKQPKSEQPRSEWEAISISNAKVSLLVKTVRRLLSRELFRISLWMPITLRSNAHTYSILKRP